MENKDEIKNMDKQEIFKIAQYFNYLSQHGCCAESRKKTLSTYLSFVEVIIEMGWREEYLTFVQTFSQGDSTLGTDHT